MVVVQIRMKRIVITATIIQVITNVMIVAIQTVMIVAILQTGMTMVQITERIIIAVFVEDTEHIQQVRTVGIGVIGMTMVQITEWMQSVQPVEQQIMRHRLTIGKIIRTIVSVEAYVPLAEEKVCRLITLILVNILQMEIEQCAYCGETFNTGSEDCSWATGSYEYCFDAYDYCRECGDTIDYSSSCSLPGDYSSNYDGTHSDYCEVCGYEDISSCDMRGPDSHGSDEHYYYCNDCGYFDGPYSCDFGSDGYCECGNYDSSTGGGGWWSHYVIRLKKNFGFLRNLFASVIWNKNWF